MAVGPSMATTIMTRWMRTRCQRVIVPREYTHTTRNPGILYPAPCGKRFSPERTRHGQTDRDRVVLCGACRRRRPERARTTGAVCGERRRLADVPPRLCRHRLFAAHSRSTPQTSGTLTRASTYGLQPEGRRRGTRSRTPAARLNSEATPIVVNGVMYMPAAGRHRRACSRRPGREVWRLWQ